MITTEDYAPIRACEGAPRIGPPPAQAVMELGWGMWASSIVQTAARMRIADAVGHEPVTLDELAVTVGANPDALARLLRALVAFGIFCHAGPHRYAHTELSLALRSDAPEHVADVMLTGSTWGWTIWGKLHDSIRTGTSAVHAIYGKDLIRYFTEDDPEAGQMCHRGYSKQAEALNPAIAAALDTTGVRTVADVGGGYGSLLCHLLRRHPGLRAVLFDSEPVIRHADPELREGKLAARCRLVAGDCLQSVPFAADLYLLRQVLHMWNDETCIRALRNCAASASHDARIVLLEQLVGDPPESAWDALMDLHMLLVMGGRERTEEEWAQLLERAGLGFKGVTGTSTPLRIIEATMPD